MKSVPENVPRPETIESGETEFVEGQPVDIVEGSLQGIRGVFTATKGEERVLLLLSILGQQTRVVMPKDHVVPAT